MKIINWILFGVTTLHGTLAGAQQFNVTRVADGKYAIRCNDLTKKDKFEWNPLPDGWSGAKRISVKLTSDTIALKWPHPIIKRSISKGKEYFSAPRAVALQGAVNFRDLGGYTTKYGKQVKWGKIYRSADISKLTDSDLSILTELHIKMVCDLRGEQEAAAAPDKLPAGVERILLSAGSESTGGTSYLKFLKDPVRADSMMTAFYTRTDHLAKKYKPVFEQLLALENDQAMMFHCTAGKDRTGVGAALILTALGVSEAQIFADYELTNESSKNLTKQLLERMKAQGLSEQAVNNMMSAKPEYLRAAFAAIAKQFGSVDQFLSNEIGLNEQKRNVLKSKFLY